MIEDYVFGYRIDGKPIRQEVLSKEDKALLMGAINYASVRDSDNKRKKAYGEFMKRLNKVVNGDKYLSRRRM